MTDDVLVQRFIDQALSAEERVRFVVELGRDASLRARVIALEQVVLEAGRLPRPSVPDGFVDRVMVRAIPPARPAWRNVVDALWTPRSLQWNLAGAAGVCLVIAAGLLMAGRTWGSAATPGIPTSSASVTTPMYPTTLVRLVVMQPGARTVEVAGDFNGWDPTRTPLEPAAGGAWTVTIPLEPGRYEYMVVIDGNRWMADPLAAEHSDDGFGSTNAVLDVRPPMGAV